MVIGFWRSWSLVVGMMIGSGIFTLPAVLAPYGAFSFVAWGLVVIGALSLVFSLSYMAARDPRAGGAQAYVYDTFGRFPAIVVAWGYWISLVVAVAAISLSFIGYLAVFIPFLTESTLATTLGALCIICLFTAVSLLGTEQASLLQLWTSVLKIIPLLLIGGLGLAIGDIGNISRAATPDQSVVPMVAGIMLLIMWSYIGIECASIPAGETKNPSKTIPLALFWGTISATVVYVMALAGVMALIPLDEVANSAHPFVDAASILFGAAGEVVVGIGALLAIGGALNACVFLTGSIPSAGAREGLFPKLMTSSGDGSVSAKPALLTSSVIACVLVLVNSSKGLIGSFELMILISTFSALIVYLGASSACTRLVFLDYKQTGVLSLWGLSCSVLGMIFSCAALYGAWTLYFPS